MARSPGHAIHREVVKLPGRRIKNHSACQITARIIVAGYFAGTTDFGGGAKASGNPSGDIFVAKYSGANNGAYLWDKTTSSSGYKSAYGVATDPNNGDA